MPTSDITRTPRLNLSRREKTLALQKRIPYLQRAFIYRFVIAS